jgi:hypothetical protein
LQSKHQLCWGSYPTSRIKPLFFQPPSAQASRGAAEVINFIHKIACWRLNAQQVRYAQSAPVGSFNNSCDACCHSMIQRADSKSEIDIRALYGLCRAHEWTPPGVWTSAEPRHAQTLKNGRGPSMTTSARGPLKHNQWAITTFCRQYMEESLTWTVVQHRFVRSGAPKGSCLRSTYKPPLKRYCAGSNNHTNQWTQLLLFASYVARALAGRADEHLALKSVIARQTPERASLIPSQSRCRKELHIDRARVLCTRSLCLKSAHVHRRTRSGHS